MLWSLLLLFVFVSHHAFAIWINDPVLDINGDALQVGARYAILPVVRGSGGGVTIGAGRNSSCFNGVVQDKFETSSGTPVVFSPVNKQESVVRISTNLVIEFSVMIRRSAQKCSPSGTWKIDFSQGTLPYFLMTGRRDEATLFKIAKNENDYNIFLCPDACDSCRARCSNVGISLNRGIRRLALTSEPLKVMFKKV